VLTARIQAPLEHVALHHVGAGNHGIGGALAVRADVDQQCAAADRDVGVDRGQPHQLGTGGGENILNRRRRAVVASRRVIHGSSVTGNSMPDVRMLSLASSRRGRAPKVADQPLGHRPPPGRSLNIGRGRRPAARGRASAQHLNRRAPLSTRAPTKSPKHVTALTDQTRAALKPFAAAGLAVGRASIRRLTIG
jgi:hypothetical protein